MSLLVMAQSFKTTILPIGIVLLFTFIAVKNLLHPGLPPTHDGEYHVIRFYEFNKVLSEGILYPRWAPDLNFGYGIPLFNYVYPLPNYVASLLHLFSASFIDAFKLNMFLASFVGAISMFFWARIFWGGRGGIIASIFYTYSPYHFLDIYIRGSVGEVWALGLFPAFLWSITKFIKEENLLFIPISSIALSLVIFSHNILALMFAPFALSYVAFLYLQVKDKKYIIPNTLYIILLGIGLSAIFWLPAILERSYVRGLEVFDYRDHFVEFYQLIFPSWGSGFSADPTTQGLSFQIGVANLIALICFIISLFIFKKKEKEKINIGIFFVLWTFLAIFLMLRPSIIIWERLPFMQYLQFPWRFLSLIILSISFLAGSIIYFWKFKLLLPTFILIIVFLGLGYTKPAYYHLRDDNYYTSRSNFIDGTNSPGEAFNTLWSNNITERKTDKLEIVKGEGEIEEKDIKTNEYEFTVRIKQDAKLLLNTMFFTGWTVFVDGKRTDVNIAENGAMTFELASGDHIVETKFLNTQPRLVGNMVFFVSLVITVLVFLRFAMRKYT